MRVRELTSGLVVAAGLFAVAIASGCGTPSASTIRLTTVEGAMGVVRLDVSDRCASSAPRVTAVGVWIDGVHDQELPLFPGAGRLTYDALIGPLAAGAHDVEIRPSAWWAPAGCVSPQAVTVTPVDPASPAYEVYRRAPVLELRADTVGEQTDVPLYAYVERLPGAGGGSMLRYSVVFSNEDGGTPTRALLARWGRTTDIEQVYDVTIAGGRVVNEAFQGPDHVIRAFHGRRRGVAPVLLVATLNNMVTDRGRGLAAVRPVPTEVNLAGATRESTMDERPWVYRVMETERAAEGRIAANAPVDDQWAKLAPDAREHVYLEAVLALEDTVAVAWVEDRAGQRYWSHYGRLPLAIERSARVRSAVAVGPQPGLAVTAAGWTCLAAPDAPSTGRCDIETSRLFVLGADYRPGDNRTSAARAVLKPGGEFRLSLKPVP